MFKSARIKLTAYYLAIMAVVLLVFSTFAYRGFLFEIRRTMREKRSGEVMFNVPPPFGMFATPGEIDEVYTQVYKEAKERVLLTLVILNVSILVLSGLGGYILAGYTLAPIEKMLSEQKRFVSDASHELRTPLTALKTEIEVSLKDKKLDLSQAKKLLISNLEEVDKMQKLSDYLLSLNKYQGGGVKPELSSINLKKAVEKAIEKTQPLAKKKEIVIEKSLKNIFIRANEISLTELAVILLDNAIKYSPRGKKVKVEVKGDDKHAVLEVKDSGMGIKSSELPYIFNRFYRADTSRSKEKVDGYGLGLSIAKAIVDTFGGNIKVKSVLGKGSTFSVEFASPSKSFLQNS
jgi:signal transduction histidine kinase